jgi:hypothetical protein
VGDAGFWRQSRAPAAATTAIARPRPITTTRLGRRTVGDGCAVTNARVNSAAVANRSAGTSASAFCTAVSTAGGTVGRKRLSGGAGWMNRFATTACGVGPVKGGSPASISWSTHPNA